MAVRGSPRLAWVRTIFLTIRERRPSRAQAAYTVASVTTDLSDEMVSDEELSVLALAADPDTVVGDDAQSLWVVLGQDQGPLPDWYMPPISAGRRIHPRWRRRVALLIICAFLAVDAYGLCSTYGYLVVA
jgi:hypothetical protein